MDIDYAIRRLNEVNQNDTARTLDVLVTVLIETIGLVAAVEDQRAQLVLRVNDLERFKRDYAPDLN